MKFVLLSVVCVLLFSYNVCFAQSDSAVTLGKYKFSTTYTDTNYSTVLKITDGKKVIFTGEFEESVESIKEVDFNDDGNKTILLSVYTGGAHCCYIVYACRIKNNKFLISDTLYLADSYFNIEDLDNNGEQKLTAYNMMFAYAFTNYAESRAPEIFYTVENGLFKEVTKDYPKRIEAQIEEFKGDLKTFLDSKYKCEAEGEETFNTDAGSVKTLLAAITADYYTLGEVEKGYELINKTYPCTDRDKFIKILKEDYKLK